ncbi:helix-turn-helix transcriptional regulator [Vibrio ostreicida]|uniref:Helix-turn-helix domain-containing protein n=1 Tax=Vibrio ostreicida TaxID=526588 RepID=A0ABT8BYZ0_9VIBR|nr:helix-turn-helix domain-containing protein [Vibrio ostreicida]MDN3612375.1 helix-turn-helix domain-containing protein [Vibrio ostreicida]NPD09854.1 helix-turn-helix transcriptional regulator [Vibrio ostreicida]
MNKAYLESSPTDLTITGCCPTASRHLLSFGQSPRCQSWGNCLGCQIDTLSGYGGCTSHQMANNEQKYCLRLLTVIKGERIVWHNGADTPLSLEKGKSVLIFSATSFNDVFISESESFVEIADIRFDCQYLTDIYQQISDKLKDSGINPRTDNRPFVFDTNVEIQQFISQLETKNIQKSSDATNHLYAVSQAYQCLSKLLNQLELIQNKKKYDDNSSLSSRTLNKIRKAHDMIASNPGKNWSINELCREVGTNETSFKRGFRLLFNTTFSKLLQQTRMTIAAKELESTDHPIIDIVFKVGYASPSHFTKLFKQHFGENPLQYRKARQFS